MIRAPRDTRKTLSVDEFMKLRRNRILALYKEMCRRNGVRMDQAWGMRVHATYMVDAQMEREAQG